MRLLIYNIRYATGTGPTFHLPVPGAGYLRSNPRVLLGIAEFIRKSDPDLVGLIEVDTGSVRSRMTNQAEFIADKIGHYSIYECKYGLSSFGSRLPILRKQSNAFLAAPRVEGERFHYFATGIKRLIIESRTTAALGTTNGSTFVLPSREYVTSSSIGTRSLTR